MKWTCFICGQVVPKYSLVSRHIEGHKKEVKKIEVFKQLLKTFEYLVGLAVLLRHNLTIL